ncbi:MAG: glycosyltransferase [Kiritimatiellia bacterium]|jgi:biofilm PGA synthesis N-glycosyltransferase PgaC|nr:glycosyltransferase [Lentisphaerota bacterium]
MVLALAISVGLLGYIYLGYPALIWALGRFWGKPVQAGEFDGGAAVLMVAHDEGERLARKLENLLELAVGEPIREVWIGLDGCTDGSAERVKSIISRVAAREGGQGLRAADIHLLECAERRGKAAVLNELMTRATQPICVMMDARQRVASGAISKLLRPFADSRVGVVSGALVYEAAAGGAQKGAETYWGYEKMIRESESRFFAVPGATGALYAIRRELCAEIPENTLVDDVLIPMRAVLQGFRCLFEPEAVVFDVPADFQRENIRKRRTLAGIWQMGCLEPRIYSIFANPIWFQWVSHKFLRLLTPFLVILAVLSLGFLAWAAGGAGSFWFWAFWGVFAVIFASFGAFVASKWVKNRFLGVLGAFFGVNWALLLAARDAWSGRFEARWAR